MGFGETEFKQALVYLEDGLPVDVSGERMGPPFISHFIGHLEGEHC